MRGKALAALLTACCFGASCGRVGTDAFVTYEVLDFAPQAQDDYETVFFGDQLRDAIAQIECRYCPEEDRYEAVILQPIRLEMTLETSNADRGIWRQGSRWRVADARILRLSVDTNPHGRWDNLLLQLDFACEDQDVQARLSKMNVGPTVVRHWLPINRRRFLISSRRARLSALEL